MEKWNKYAEGWINSHKYLNLEESHKDRLNILRKFCFSSKRLLDVGCGSFELIRIKNDKDSARLQQSMITFTKRKKVL